MMPSLLRLSLIFILLVSVYLHVTHNGHDHHLLATTHSTSLYALTAQHLHLHFETLSKLVSQCGSHLDEESEPREFTRHIVAVGDLHGHFPNALKVLQFSGVVDEFGNWTGNADFFVQTGDMIDRGDDTIKLYGWMDQLREQATATGGVVLNHLGNHEYMNAIGDWRYVYPTELKTFGSVSTRQQMISTGRIGRSWASNYTVTSRLPLHPSLGPPNTPYSPSVISKDEDQGEELPFSHSAISFVHGGLSPTYENLVPFPTKINELGTTLLRKLQKREQPPPYPPNPYSGLPVDATQEEVALYAENGPLWYRGWALQSEEQVCKDVDAVLEKTGTRRMIMGHTPDFEKIVSRCGGKIIIIDTGITPVYGGVLSALSIHYTLTPLSTDKGTRREKRKWIEKEVVSALYVDRQEVIVVDEREVVGDF
ncbi:Metallo-dependent phosphatase [Marasmius fiardii PR-910]|nr:Metallo-dependent phosphatase [Marasmius fiardii PR-910]